MELNNLGISGDMPMTSRFMTIRKRPRQIGPTDDLYIPSVGSSKHGEKDRERTLNDACKEELREKANMAIARWMYQSGIPFNAINYPSFQKFVNAVGKYGKGLELPTIEELRGPLLKNAIDKINRKYVKPREEEWARHGCTLMVDSWTDNRQRTFINFLVNSSGGSAFLESVDASDSAKAELKMLQLLDKFVERVGESAVVQVVTENTNVMMLAGKYLQVKRPALYWTPCAARCINSILEDIGKLPSFKATTKKATSIAAYIYSRPCVLNMLLQFTGRNELLLRAGITKFATIFLTLERMQSLKEKLSNMFSSQEWKESKWIKEAPAEKITNIVLSTSFWDIVLQMLKTYGPLLDMLRLVGDYAGPSMGFIYNIMDKTKEAIKDGLEGNEEIYREVFGIIDKRWDCQLRNPLHAAGHYLNPVFFSTYKYGIDVPSDVANGFLDSVEKLVFDLEEQEKIISQVCAYQRAEGLFGKDLAIRMRNKLRPADWWGLFGSHTPELQKFAIKVLSLVCSASGFDHSWNVFKRIHGKKRNRLDQQCMNDVLYVKCNRFLKRKYGGVSRVNPILLDGTDVYEWMVKNILEGENDLEELVFDGEDLTWDDVVLAVGPEQVVEEGKGKEKEKENEIENGKGNATSLTRGSILRLRQEEEEDDEENEKVEENEEDEKVEENEEGSSQNLDKEENWHDDEENEQVEENEEVSSENLDEEEY